MLQTALEKVTAALALFFIDQVSKWIVRTNMIESGSLVEATTNTGSAFATPLPTYIIIPAAFLILTVSLLLAIGSQMKLHAPALILIFAGGVSNMADRIILGGVTDILHIGYLSLNIADLFIVIGIIMLFKSKILPKNKIQKVSTAIAQ